MVKTCLLCVQVLDGPKMLPRKLCEMIATQADHENISNTRPICCCWKAVTLAIFAMMFGQVSFPYTKAGLESMLFDRIAFRSSET